MGISELNEMQKATAEAVNKNAEVVLISPTGTGKTLAFLLPIIAHLEQKTNSIQAIILVPARELAIQIDQCIGEKLHQ